ncbi:hypothetical protein GE21DRAFT_8899 [Neurospora crassa]|uniref:Uncharacterized protein n=2 Tax=Neurospora crassa TaxID=5141 RepID=Q7S5V1_NEUCR|nr:hypothetical protein NCU05615 [Neurospora crassa OR74A]EAA30905.1 hypothetical protein NCU05615 [Neurospora crassa OR74A]KHE78327.1 hypothetical protein GE21DRAFT_8899 [Neurospora crassa]CAF06275.1 hypothetical protein [Neurospora crassa]|eukprot:XP_960141.1 hypothetical protein NCU05615 [Neurospora crassa OR74A]
MDNHHSSSAPSSKRSSTLSPPVKKALTLKEQRVLYAAKAKAAGKGDAEPAFRTVRVRITSVTPKNISRHTTKPTSKSPKTASAGYGPKVVMKENLRPSSKFAAKTSTISSPVIKKALTLKEQRALYAAKHKVVTPGIRRVSSARTGSEPLTKRSVNRNYSTSPAVSTASAPAAASSVGSPTSPPVAAKRALTLKEQMALYAARGKVTTPVLREVIHSNVDVGSPIELAVRRYYSSSSTSSKASPSASISPKTNLDKSSVISRTSASTFSRTATKDSASSSSRGSLRTSKPPICPQSTIRKALAKFEQEEEAEAEAALERSPGEKTTSTSVPKTSGGYTLKEQMKFAAAKRAAVKKADVEGSAKTFFAEGSSTSGRKKRSRDEASLDNRKDDGSGCQTESFLSRGNKRAKWC